MGVAFLVLSFRTLHDRPSATRELHDHGGITTVSGHEDVSPSRLRAAREVRTTMATTTQHGAATHS